MAIEIKELIIKLTVSEKMPFKQAVHAGLTPGEKKQLVNECVQKILEKLESKVER